MVYVHIPFCQSFCTYCGFYSEVCSSAAQWEDYVTKVCREAAARSSEMAECPAGNTLYIGGGTPSVLPLSALGRIVRAIPGAPFEEFTIEVNPEDIVAKGPDYVRGLRGIGADRISMGVQSFDDGILHWMNRRHDAARAREAFRLLREGGFRNISIDLIFGVPGLTSALWERTLGEAIALGPEHISAYQLSIEEGSALAENIAAGAVSEASEDECRRQYDRLCLALADAGYRHYEVSNFARPGFEARHNSAYWRRVPYVGLGPGAHSLLPDGRTRRWNTESLPDWTTGEESLSGEDIRVERLMLGLRTAAGLPGEELRRLADPAVVERLRAEGALVEIPGQDGETALRIPEDRFFVSDEIIRELL